MKVAKQFKKMQPGSSSHGGGASDSYPEGGSIGVPMDECPLDDDNRVPLLVRTCCTIVENRGLEVVGVYRVPGNSAAVNQLTEQVNRGEFRLEEEPRWSDVNVVSSLLKSFFRKLPEPLFTAELYPIFIEASKIEDPSARLHTLRKLARDLPDINYETLKFVCLHLCRVINRCEVNKMEVKNLAIVFGPTLVRTAEDSMLAMVTDMSQQCRIIESVLNHCDWFFCDYDADSSSSAMMMDDFLLSHLAAAEEANLGIMQTGDAGLLLHNLQKLEESGKMMSPGRDVSAKDIMSGIISAANRKMHRHSKSSANKRDSLDYQHPQQQLQQMLQQQQAMAAAAGGSSSNLRLEAPIRPQSSSRRNSESVIHSAMTIVSAVPQLMGNSATANSSTSNIPAKLVSDLASASDSGSQLRPPAKLMSVSAENISQIMSVSSSSSSTIADKENSRVIAAASTTTSSSSSTIITSSTNKASASSAQFPLESYSGLEAAMAQKVKMFEDETKQMLLMRSAQHGSVEPLTGRFEKKSNPPGV